jgi:hypothetical protein
MTQRQQSFGTAFGRLNGARPHTVSHWRKSGGDEEGDHDGIR